MAANNFTGNPGTGFKRRDIVISSLASFFLNWEIPPEAAWKLAAPEVRHGKREIQARVNKVAQNLHVLNMAVEAEKEGLDSCCKHARFCAVHRPAGRALDAAQRPFVLEKYIH